MKTKLHCTFDDTALRWAMRLTGLLLAVGSLFFLSKNLVIGATDDWVFAIGSGLGLLTFGVSMIPLQNVKQRAQNLRNYRKTRTHSLRPVQP